MVVTKVETPYFDSFMTLQIRYVHCKKKKKRFGKSKEKNENHFLSLPSGIFLQSSTEM